MTQQVKDDQAKHLSTTAKKKPKSKIPPSCRWQSTWASLARRASSGGDSGKNGGSWSDGVSLAFTHFHDDAERAADLAFLTKCGLKLAKIEPVESTILSVRLPDYADGQHANVADWFRAGALHIVKCQSTGETHLRVFPQRLGRRPVSDYSSYSRTYDSGKRKRAASCEPVDKKRAKVAKAAPKAALGPGEVEVREVEVREVEVREVEVREVEVSEVEVRGVEVSELEVSELEVREIATPTPSAPSRAALAQDKISKRAANLTGYADPQILEDIVNGNRQDVYTAAPAGTSLKQLVARVRTQGVFGRQHCRLIRNLTSWRLGSMLEISGRSRPEVAHELAGGVATEVAAILRVLQTSAWVYEILTKYPFLFLAPISHSTFIEASPRRIPAALAGIPDLERRELERQSGIVSGIISGIDLV